MDHVQNYTDNQYSTQIDIFVDLFQPPKRKKNVSDLFH